MQKLSEIEEAADKLSNGWARIRNLLGGIGLNNDIYNQRLQLHIPAVVFQSQFPDITERQEFDGTLDRKSTTIGGLEIFCLVDKEVSDE